VLTRAHRLVNPLDFKRVVRRGDRYSGKYVTVHVLAREGLGSEPSADASIPQARAGFVVSKAVGGAVIRNRVKRRLRALVSTTNLEPGVDIVIRAAPSCSGASFGQLEAELQRLLHKATTS
jgi:ribonuclease P protein component